MAIRIRKHIAIRMGIVGVALAAIAFFRYVTLTSGQTQTVKRLVAPCQSYNADDPKFKQCWERAVRVVLPKYGIDVALDMLTVLFADEKRFGQTCHDLTHIIGQEAFKRFMNKETFVVTPKSAYCNYGFFHGAIEALTAKTGDVREARKFCDFVEKNSSLNGPDATYHCYHGIGHGTVVVHDTKLYGDERAIIAPAMKICEEVADNEETLTDCATGIFAGMANFYREGLYGLVVKTSDPLWLCRTVPAAFAEPCYRDMSWVTLVSANYDYRRAISFLEAIPQDAYAISAMRSFGADLGEFVMGKGPDSGTWVSMCRSPQGRLLFPCIQSMVRELVQNGTPGDELTEALGFCASAGLATGERDACYDWAFTYLRWYTPDTIERICGSVLPQYQAQCGDSQPTRGE